jgi:hypothetical protein
MGLPSHAGPKYDVQGNPCGCMMINIPNRMAIAIPCVKHVGMVKVSMEYDKEKGQPIAGTGPIFPTVERKDLPSKY